MSQEETNEYLPEWTILFKYQREFREKFKISGPRFLYSLGLSNGIIRFLYSENCIPSNVKGSAGLLLRETIYNLMISDFPMSKTNQDGDDTLKDLLQELYHLRKLEKVGISDYNYNEKTKILDIRTYGDLKNFKEILCDMNPKFVEMLKDVTLNSHRLEYFI